jgi:hypothetical protein
MALEVEGIVHGGMNAQKALGRCIDARAHNARARGTGSWAGGSGRALADRPADPVCEKFPDPFRGSNRASCGKHISATARPVAS